MMIVNFNNLSDQKVKAFGNAGLIFGGVYAAIIIIIYYTQLTSPFQKKRLSIKAFAYDSRHKFWYSMRIKTIVAIKPG
jgi:hypothetical protein